MKDKEGTIDQIATTSEQVLEAKRNEEVEQAASQEKSKKTLMEVETLTEKMNDSWTKFCVTLNPDQFYESLDIQKQLVQKKIPQSLVQVSSQLAITTAELFQRGFKQFPQMADYDYTIEQLNLLQAAQDNLQHNLANDTLLGKFTVLAQETAKNLEKQYGSAW